MKNTAILLVPQEDWQADEYRSFVVEMVLAEGIAAGGSLLCMFQHALMSIDRDWQTIDPAGGGYIKAECEGRTDLSWVEWPNEAQKRILGVWRHGVQLRIHEPMVAGKKIRIIFGANDLGVRIPIYTCENNEIRLIVDHTGDGEYTHLGSLHNSILAGRAQGLFVTAPASLVVGEVADVHVRAEDGWHNLDRNCNIQVRIVNDGQETAVRLQEGIGRVRVPMERPGVYRFCVETVDEGLYAKAWSNPVIVTAKEPEYRLYWGDLHGHTKLSDGLGSDAEEYYRYARDLADLDVCALADHGPREPARVATRSFNEPGRFVTIWGYEWAGSDPGRVDRNIYLYDEDDPLPVSLQGQWPKTIEVFWEQMEKTFGNNEDQRVIVGPHMFTYPSTGRLWYETWNPRFDRFIEIYSEHGMSEYYGNPRMLAGTQRGEAPWFAVSGLRKGVRCAFIGSSDNHDSHPGRGAGLTYPGGIVAFFAKDLTRESIWEAFWKRRVYAATTDRIFLDFQIDGHRMGEEFLADGALRITYTVHGCCDGFDVFVVKNGQDLKRHKVKTGSLSHSMTDEDFQEDSFYYLRVVQDNGEWAWSSPIWVNALR